MNLSRLAAWVGYFGLLGLWIGWATVFAPARHAPAGVVLAITALPLLIPLRGFLYDRRGSFLWLGLLSLVYFMHGVSAATDASQRIPAGLEIALSLCLFAGALARLRMRENH